MIESAIESAVNNDLSSHDKHIQKGEELSCVICRKNFKSENNLKNHDLRYHMIKGIQHGYSCEYCSKSFLEKKKLSWTYNK